MPTAIKDQMKASEIMAEKLPGLIDPNLPPDQQPLHDSSNPNLRAAAAAAAAPRRVLAGRAQRTPGSEPDTEPAPRAADQEAGDTARR